MTPSVLAEETLRILSPENPDQDRPLEVSDARVGLALIQLAAGKEVTAVALGDAPWATAEQAQRVMRQRMLSPSASHYSVLGVPHTATGGDIRENYRRLIALVHPDSRPKGLPADSAIQVNLAYAVLADPEARARYDATLASTIDAAASATSASRAAAVGANAPQRPSSHRSVRFEFLRSALTARRALVWMAVLLVLPLIWAVATRGGAPAPTKLVEARPRLLLERDVASAQDTPTPAVPPTAVSAPAPVPPPTPMALAASRSLTLESERRIARATTDATVRTPVAAPQSAATAPVHQPSPGAEALASDGVTQRATAPLRPISAEGITPRPSAARSSDAVAELLTQLADAVEAGSAERLGVLFAERLPGRAKVLSDFEQVFRSTRRRELRYLRIDPQRHAQSETFSGVAELGLTAADGTQSVQRLFLSGTVERRGERLQLASWSSYPMQ